tara:strand:- start:587 stop:946 length:360 start_codon:yes stop_codon:yes gene_type:complete
MTQQIALDTALHDIIKVDGGGIVRTIDGRYTTQLVKCKLLTLLGEWRLDTTKGWINYNDYKRNPDLFGIELKAREVILSCKGVQKIDSLTLELSKRILTVSFQATTIYGGIDLTIPWSM